MNSQSRFCLPMLEVATQVPSRVAPGVSEIRSTSNGQEEAVVNIFAAVLNEKTQRASSLDLAAEVEAVRPGLLAEELSVRLQAREDLSSPGFEAETLARRSMTLRDLQVAANSPLARDAAALSVRVVCGAYDKLRAVVETTAAAQPSLGLKVVERIRELLSAMPLPEPDLSPVRAFCESVRRLDDVEAHSSMMARTTYEFLLARTRDRARSGYALAVGALALVLVVAESARARGVLEESLEQTRRNAADFNERVGLIRAALEAEQKNAADRGRVAPKSSTVALPGPDADAVITGMKERAGCKTTSELAKRFLAQFEERLRDLARQRCPALDTVSAGLLRLILEIDPRDAAEAFRGLVATGLGGGHSLWSIIEAQGVEGVADSLYRHSEPTCRVGQRDLPVFGVQSTEVTVVRLPASVGSRDGAIRDSFSEELRRRCGCNIVPAEEGEDVVTIVRLQAGWPIGIEESNRVLLLGYLRAAKQGHCPHLVGVLPESPEGRIVSDCTRLINGAPPH